MENVLAFLYALTYYRDMSEYVPVPVAPKRQPLDLEPIFASVKEAAVVLKLSEPKLYKMARKGQVPFRRYGAAIRIPWAWVREQNKVEPPAVEVEVAP